MFGSFHSSSCFVVAVAVSLGAPLVACNGSVDGDAGGRSSSASTGAGSVPADPTTPVDPGLEPEPVPMKPDAPLATIEARCEDVAHGVADDFVDYQGLKTKLFGRWYACNRSTTGLYSREAGIEFRSGTWNLIRREANGTFTTLTGVENQGTWGEKYTDFTGYFQVDTVDGLVLTTFAFEDAPVRLRTSGMDHTGAEMPVVWFVPMAE